MTVATRSILMAEQTEFGFEFPPERVKHDQLPYQRGSRSSWEAAQAARPHADIAKQRIVEVLRQYEPLSDRQLQEHLVMSGDTERPRRIELLRDGIIEQAGEVVINGRRQAVWKLTKQ